MPDIIIHYTETVEREANVTVDALLEAIGDERDYFSDEDIEAIRNGDYSSLDGESWGALDTFLADADGEVTAVTEREVTQVDVAWTDGMGR